MDADEAAPSTNEPPVADANGPYAGDEGSSIEFDGSGSYDPDGTIVSYEWVFDYGGTTFTVDTSGVDLTNPSHTYVSEGTYTVALRVKDDDGDISSISTATVTITTPDEEAPVITDATGDIDGTTDEPVTISASITDNVGVVSATVHYTPIGTTDETTAAMTKEATSDVWSAVVPVDSDKVGTITYYITAQDAAPKTARDPAEGTYSITVTDDDAPVAEAGPDQSVLVTEEVIFDGSGSSDNIGITSYSWDFDASNGIGEDANGVTATHTYTTAGDYTVTLTVDDAAGNGPVSDAVTVTVSETPVEVVAFEDSFEGGLDKWEQDSQKDWFRSTQRKTDGSGSAEVDGRATDATLTMANAIDLSEKASATLTFSWFIEGSWDNGEYIKLDISTDGGDSWTEVNSIDGKSRTSSGPDENKWIPVSVDLREEDRTDNFKIRFRAKVSSSREDGNVDNVTIITSAK